VNSLTETAGRSLELAQAPITPRLPTPAAGDDAPAPTVTPALPSPSADTPATGTPRIAPRLPGAGGAVVAPQLPGASAPPIAPRLPGSPAPAAASPPSAPVTHGDADAGTLSIRIANPAGLSIPPGTRELTLVVRSEDEPQAPPPETGIGFLEIFTAVVLAMVVAPLVRREAGKWTANLNALDFVRRNGFVVSAYLLAFTAGWMVFMIALPQLYMFDFSFRFNLPPNEIGGVNDVYTLKNYQYLLFGRPGDTELLNWLHLEVFFKTIVASALVTLLNFAFCYPLAYFMAQSAKGAGQRLLFLCLILPFWVNEILRAFAFKLIFAEQGLINTLLVGLGVIDSPFDFFKADVALYTGLMYAYLLLMIFPLYNAIESLDHNQIEAARDLGASWWKIHFRVVMPYAKPGIASGCTMVFMLSAGALAAPNILGGPSSLWFTQIIYQWYNTGGNWPQGSAYAFVLLTACIVFVMTVMRVFKVSLGDIAKR
jgi:spermidine/putrescine transport system permease protein